MKKPILVTGIHRSGSTWVGSILSDAPGLQYIHEPFNLAIRYYGQPFHYWYQYITSDMDAEFQRQALTYMKSFYVLPLYLKKIRGADNTKKFFHFIRGIFEIMGSNRPLIKDPLALMSTEWLHEKLDCDVVISIRHPAAFAASLKVKETWDFKFNQYLGQEKLMERYLSDYYNDIKANSENPPDMIKQSVTLWNTIYHTVHLYQEKYKNTWHFIKHEDLSTNPMELFQDLFNKLDLKFTGKVRKKLIESTTAKVPGKLKRDSKENIKSWKKRLSAEEIAYVKKETYAVWKEYYTEDDWS